MSCQDYETLNQRQKLSNTLECWDYIAIHSLSLKQSPAKIREILMSQLVKKQRVNSKPEVGTSS